MKTSIFILIFFFGCYVQASAEKEKAIEPAIMECQYDHTAVRDTLDRSHVMKDRMILRIGKNVSQFYGTPCKEIPCGQTQEEERLPQKEFLKPYVHRIMKIL